MKGGHTVPKPRVWPTAVPRVVKPVLTAWNYQHTTACLEKNGWKR